MIVAAVVHLLEEDCLTFVMFVRTHAIHQNEGYHTEKRLKTQFKPQIQHKDKCIVHYTSAKLYMYSAPEESPVTMCLPSCDHSNLFRALPSELGCEQGEEKKSRQFLDT